MLPYRFGVFALLLAMNSSPAPARAAAPAVDPAAKKHAMLMAQPLTGSTIFSGTKFPKIDLLNRDLVEAAVGPVTGQIRYYNAQWNAVTSPGEPGRYGAEMTFTAPGGVAWTRRVTLFKTPQPYAAAKDPYGLSIQLPDAFGIPGDLSAREAWNVNFTGRRMLGDQENSSDRLAQLVAGLHDIAADPARWQGFSCFFMNFQWWSELGRRLGENQDYRYLSYTPPDYDKDPARRWPLLIFLHGSGERGDDVSVVRKWGPITWLDQGHSVPMIVVEPQCPEQEWWDPVRLARLVDKISAQRRVDPKRIYFTGLSMGGFGSIEFAATYPDRVAAIAPLSGGEDPAIAPRLGKMPAWFFHGADDEVVPAQMSQDLADALRRQGAPVKLTIYPGVGHEKWDVTYANPALYSWFLSQSK
jgi:predicted esterase